jgi:hypothetical protein
MFRYAFTPRTDQVLRPLRDPDAVDGWLLALD